MLHKSSVRVQGPVWIEHLLWPCALWEALIINRCTVSHASQYQIASKHLQAVSKGSHPKILKNSQVFWGDVNIENLFQYFSLFAAVPQTFFRISARSPVVPMLRLAATLWGLGSAMPWADSSCQAAPGCDALQLEGECCPNPEGTQTPGPHAWHIQKRP